MVQSFHLHPQEEGTRLFPCYQTVPRIAPSTLSHTEILIVCFMYKKPHKNVIREMDSLYSEF